jgi:uncharacterized protein (DUF2461 family)
MSFLVFLEMYAGRKKMPLLTELENLFCPSFYIYTTPDGAFLCAAAWDAVIVAR